MTLILYLNLSNTYVEFVFDAVEFSRALTFNAKMDISLIFISLYLFIVQTINGEEIDFAVCDQDFADDFATSLSKFDEVRLLDIYPARELPIEGITSEWLLSQITNKNKKFDDFTREQLAGDLLPNPSKEQLVASCYNRLNMITHEGGGQDKEYFLE